MQNIDILLKPSTIAIVLIIAMWLGSMIAIVSLHHTGWIMLLLLIIITLYGFTILYSHGLLRGPRAIKGLRHISGEHWQIIRNKDAFMAILTGDSTVTLKLCVLRFKIPGNTLKHSYVLFYDSFRSDMYRRLLLQLRCFKST